MLSKQQSNKKGLIDLIINLCKKHRKEKQMNNLIKKFVNFLKDEEGATAVEYALMVALIAVVIIGAVTFLGDSVSNVFSNVGNQIDLAS